jgi:hypothetical protein
MLVCNFQSIPFTDDATFLPTAFALAALLALPASASTPVTLDQAMAHPDWIGNPVEAAWWSWDGKQVYYKQKRTGSPLRDTFAVGARQGRTSVQVRMPSWRSSTAPTWSTTASAPAPSCCATATCSSAT